MNGANRERVLTGLIETAGMCTNTVAVITNVNKADYLLDNSFFSPQNAFGGLNKNR